MSTTTTRPPAGGQEQPEDDKSAKAPPSVEAGSIGDAFRAWVTRVRGGEVGVLPAMLGLVVLFAVFATLRPDTFLTPYNMSNLVLQASGVVILAMGLVFVLLLGEIDLSAGYAGGTAACVLGIVMTRQGLPWPIAVAACLVTGAIIGLAIGLLVARLGIPSFVVTLAFFLALQGVMLILIGEGGTIPYRNDVILAVMNANMPLWLGWALTVGAILAYALSSGRRRKARKASGLRVEPSLLWILKITVLAVVLLGFTLLFSIERAINANITSLKGLPWVVLVLGVLAVGLTLLLSRTAWGRHVYAVGGNAEAARRAGINVARVRLSCFMMCSTLAAIAGIVLASRTNSVSPSTGGSDTLLYAVGAAVIGGTSLFGGKGRVVDAIIGGLVVAVIINGLILLNQSAGRQYMVTGIVLLVAASVDAISRKRAASSGRV